MQELVFHNLFHLLIWLQSYNLLCDAASLSMSTSLMTNLYFGMAVFFFSFAEVKVVQ